MTWTACSASHDIRTGRSVAIKALRTTSAEDPPPRSHLRREAQLLTGRPPSTGDDPIFVAYQHVREPAPQAGTGVPSLEAVIAKALAKDRAERFQSAQAFRAALRSATGAWPTTTSLARPDLHHHASTALA